MILQSLLCVFGLHRTRLVDGWHLALIGCVDCGWVEQVWRVSRPEIANMAALEHARVMADRARRVARSTTVKPLLWRVK